MDNCMLTFFANTLVLTGAVILIGALATVKRLINQLPQGYSRKSWYTMTALIIMFVIGYVFYIAAFWSEHTNALDLIVPVIFFFGACFVWLSATLSANVMQAARQFDQASLSGVSLSFYKISCRGHAFVSI